MAFITNAPSPHVCSLLEKIFPQEECGRGTASTLVLHFFIALNKPANIIRTLINRQKTTTPNFANHCSEVYYKLTPLALCVLTRNREIAQLLLDEGADPKIPDSRGWTPLHHAAVQEDQVMLDILVNKVGQSVALTMKTLSGQSYQDLTNLLNPPAIDPNQEVFSYRNIAGQVVRGTASVFKTLTNANYVNAISITSGGLIDIWHQGLSEISKQKLPGKDLMREAFNQSLDPSSAIYLAKDRDDAPYGWDVRANQNLQAFQGITIYGGEFSTSSSDNEYRLCEVDGKRMRNLGPMINDGFPNCIYFPFNHQGIPYSVFTAIQPIKKDEKLLWNYGYQHWDSKVNNPHFELNPHELENYVQSTNLDQMSNKLLNWTPLNLTKLDAYQKALLYNMADLARLGYLLETPSSMLYLLSKGLLPSEAVAQILNQTDTIFRRIGLITENKKDRADFAVLCWKVDNFLKNNQEKNKELVADIRKVLQEWSETQPAIAFMSAMSFLVDSLKNEISSMEIWNEFKQDLNCYLLLEKQLSLFCSSDFEGQISFTDISGTFGKLSPKKQEHALSRVALYASQVKGEKAKFLSSLCIAPQIGDA